MASADVCDPCLESNTTVHAEKYCSECEQKLCAECIESHRLFKALKSHHVIDLSSVGARIPPSSKINCEIHTGIQIEYFCSQHDVVCCRACIPDCHRSCKTVIPLDIASKNVKNSSLLCGTLKELDNMTETLEKISENRDDNRKLLQQKKSLIIKQISTVLKPKLLKPIDGLEERIIAEVASVHEKSEEIIKKEKDELSQLTSILKDIKQELVFLKDHGSDNQLFLALRKQITKIQKTDHKIHDMTSAINEIDMEFEEIKNFNIETIGSVSQITRPCPIKYKSMNVQHPQVQQDGKPLTEFIKEGELNLIPGEAYDLRCMAVTSDNKLLLCNYESSHPKVYIYRDCKTYEDEIRFTSKPWSITVVPCTEKAVVTLPKEESIQFINTTTKRKDKKIRTGEGCRGVTVVKDKIYLDGVTQVLILNTDGSRVREITTDACYKFNIVYNDKNGQLLLREMRTLRCINLDGHLIYRYTVSGGLGLTVDRQDYVYLCGNKSNDIHRLSPDGTFRDIVLSEHDGVDQPFGIAFNNDFTKLFIINKTKTVLVYSCR